MKNIPLVSVIIPLYNSSKYIKKAIISVLTQTYRNIEVIVVDDGSSDAGPAIVKEIIKDGKRVRLFEQENRGACAARNLGFSSSKGDFIQFLDADDLLSPNKIEDQLKVLTKSPGCIANGSWGRFNYKISEPIKWMPHPKIQKDLEPLDWLLKNHMSTNHAWLTPRELIEKAGLWREDLVINQDGEFFSRVILQSKKVLYTPEAKVYYRSNISGSISSGIQKPKAIASRFKTIQLLEELIWEKEQSLRVNKFMADLYQGFIYSYYPKCIELVRKAENKVKIYGGSSLPVPGGKFYRTASVLVGWKTVSWLKFKLGRL